MKLLVFCAVLSLLGLTQAEDFKKKMAAAHGECVKQTLADPQKINAIKSGDWTDTEHNTRKYVLCMMMHAKIMDIDAVVNREKAIEIIPPDSDKETVEKAVDECSKLRAKIAEDQAWAYAKCFQARVPTFHVL